MSKKDKKKIGRDLFDNKQQDELSSISSEIDRPLSFDEALRDDSVEDEQVIRKDSGPVVTEVVDGEVTTICGIYTDHDYNAIVVTEFDGQYYYIKQALYANNNYPEITEDNLSNELSEADVFSVKLESLKTLFEQADMKKKGVVYVSNVGGQNIIEQHRLRVNGDDEILAKLNEVMITPFDSINTKIEFQVLGESVSTEGKVFNVLAAAVDNKRFFDNYGLVSALNIDCDIMDLDVMSIVNLFEFTEKPDPDKILCVLDIGYELSSIIIYSKTAGEIYKRNLDFTFRSFQKQVAKNRDITKVEAEELIRSTNFYTFTTKAFELETQETLNKRYPVKDYIKSNLLSEIQKTFQFYASKNGSKIPEKIYLTGVGSLLVNFDSFFSKTVDIKSEFLNITKRFKGGNEVKNRVDRDSHIFTKALGLALRNR